MNPLLSPLLEFLMSQQAPQESGFARFGQGIPEHQLLPIGDGSQVPTAGLLPGLPNGPGPDTPYDPQQFAGLSEAEFNGTAPAGPGVGGAGFTDFVAPEPEIPGLGLGATQTPGLSAQPSQLPTPQEQFNPFSGFFKGNLSEPNGLTRLARGYETGGVVGALGMLGTDFSKQGNRTSVPDRINDTRRQRKQGGLI